MTATAAVQPGTVIRVTSGEKPIGELIFIEDKSKYGKRLKSGTKQIVQRLGKQVANRVILTVMAMHLKDCCQDIGHFQIGGKSFRFIKQEASAPKKRKAG